MNLHGTRLRVQCEYYLGVRASCQATRRDLSQLSKASRASPGTRTRNRHSVGARTDIPTVSTIPFLSTSSPSSPWRLILKSPHLSTALVGQHRTDHGHGTRISPSRSPRLLPYMPFPHFEGQKMAFGHITPPSLSSQHFKLRIPT